MRPVSDSVTHVTGSESGTLQVNAIRRAAALASGEYVKFRLPSHPGRVSAAGAAWLRLGSSPSHSERRLVFAGPHWHRAGARPRMSSH